MSPLGHLIVTKRRFSDDSPAESSGIGREKRFLNDRNYAIQDDTMNNVATVDNDEVMVESLAMSTSASAAPATGDGESQEWQRTTQRVVKSVVSIHFTFVGRFDTESALVSEATGFVVDADRGIIMTNRHVVGPGPFTGYAVFDNHEECEVLPIYRDPVHDFGFVKFDPSKIKHMKVRQLDLRPELAKIGCEIRVVGNDAGEKLSILSGFISRLDRNAPDYGGLSYNDFNTEYIQAAASASGGSSGSPVINIDGHVVALQAGGSTEASTDFFLPLYRGKRALECIQQGLPVTRGTIQVQWILRPFDECRRLGLTELAEKEARSQFPDSIGLLVAFTVVPEGPSYEVIQEGDCLISVNGEKISKFTRLDEILDNTIGNSLNLELQRGGKSLNVDIPVQDLHSITPNRYVEACGAVFHDLSYQVARLYSIPVKGVYIADASGAYRRQSWSTGYILDEVDNKPTPNLDAFVEVMKTIPDGKRVAIRYRYLADLHTVSTGIILIDRKWYPTFRMATRNDETGLWDYKDLSKGVKVQPRIETLPQEARFPAVELEEPGCTKLLRSFVQVSVTNHARIEGYYISGKTEIGLVVDAEKGLVLVSRYAVPHDLCEIHITIADSVIVPGKVVFLHPLQNYAIVSYDPKLVEAPIESAVLGTDPIKIGQKVTFIGHNHNMRKMNTNTRVTDISTVMIPLGSDLSPRYRGVNTDAIYLESTISNDCGSGVLADSDGTVRGLWLSFLADTNGNGRDREYRLAIDASGGVRSIIEKLRSGQVPNPRFLDIEMNSLTIVQARLRGVGDEWIRKVEKSSPQRPQLFNVLRVAQGAADILREGDVILAINDNVVTSISDFDVMYDFEELKVTIVRNNEEMTLTVPTVSNKDIQTTRAINWCGSVIHKPHHAVTQEIKKPPSGVYVVWCAAGSPALQYGLASTYFIINVNGVDTPTLDDFAREISNVPDNSYVKLRLVTFDGVQCACSIKTNYHYFPTSELERDDNGEWKSYIYEGGVKKLEGGDDKKMEEANQ